MVSSFACATLTEIVMRALEVENAHERYNIAKGSGQIGRQLEIPRG